MSTGNVSMMGRWAIGLLLIWGIVALLEPVLVHGDMDNPSKTSALLGYSYYEIDTDHSLRPPFSKGEHGLHILGTDRIGRDVLAGMVHGAKVAFIISFLTIVCSFVVGGIVGMATGYYMNDGIRRNILQQILLALYIMVSIYYFISLVSGKSIGVDVAILVIGSIFTYFGQKILGRLPIKKYGLPLDFVVQRIFEMKESLPSLFIILILVSMISMPSIYALIAIMVVLFWINFARHFRAETLRLRNEEFVTFARSSGISDWRLMWNHILPNALPPILVVASFASASVILMEASLSFLGIGLPLEEVTWGKILAEARTVPKAWWLAVFPGMAIFLVIFSLNTIGDMLSKRHRK